MCKILVLMFFLGIHAMKAQPVEQCPENPHYLCYHGSPLLVVSSGEHYGAVLNPDFDYMKYLHTLQDEGMNYTRVFSGFYMETPGQFGIKHNSLAPAPSRVITPWARSRVPGYSNGGNKFDLDQWDPRYFERLHAFVSEAEKRNIIVEMVLFTSIYNKENWNILPVNPGNNINHLKLTDFRKVNTLSDSLIWSYQEKMVRKIVRELNPYDNVIYEIQNEPWADNGLSVLDINAYDPESGRQWVRRVDIANEASLKWQHEIARVIKSEEATLPGKHLIAQNYCNFKYPVKDVDPVVNIMNFHYVYPENVKMNYGFNRVISFDESGFAGSDADTYRHQAWRFILAGGGIFNNLDYSFYPGFEDGTGTNQAPGGGDTELRSQLKILHDFITGFDFVRMRPDPDVIILSPGLQWQALSLKGSVYAIYLEGNPGNNLKLSIPGGDYSFSWMNPANGKILLTGTIQVTSPETSLQLPGFSNEIALKIIAE